MGLLSLKIRESLPELMDAPDLDPHAHAQALAGLQRLNQAAGSPRQMADTVLRFAKKRHLKKLSLLDVACGGGDVTLGVAQTLQFHGIDPDITLFDMSATALDRAQAQVQSAGITARAVRGKVPDSLPAEQFDIVMNTLFLHHLPRETVVAALREMSARTKGLLVISDLRRSVPGFWTAWVMCRLLTRSPIVHYDGPISVRGAWTIPEMQQMAREAGLHNATVTPCFPFRMKLVEEK